MDGSDLLSYTSLLSAVSVCSEKLRKHKGKSIVKMLPHVSEEMDKLCLCVRRQNMNSVSPSSRVYEAQHWMNRAAVERHAGSAENEAECYVLAGSIWIAVERERRAVNFPTADDALARSVLCYGMACNALLACKYNLRLSPIPPNWLQPLGSPQATSNGMASGVGIGAAGHVNPQALSRDGYHVSLPLSDEGCSNISTKVPCPYLAKSWSICHRLATVLAEFSCLEMACDYHELAAVIVSTASDDADIAQESSLLDERFGGESSSEAGTNPSFASRQHVDPNSRGATPSNFSPSSFSVLSASGSTRIRRDDGGSTSDKVAPTSQPAGSKVHGNGGVVPGFLFMYLTSLTHCAETLSLAKDYARALNIIEEALNKYESAEEALKARLEGACWKTWAVATSNVMLLPDDRDPSQKRLFEDDADVELEQTTESANRVMLDSPVETEGRPTTLEVDDANMEGSPNPSRSEGAVETRDRQSSQHARHPSSITSGFPVVSPEVIASPKNANYQTKPTHPAHHLLTTIEFESFVIRLRVMKVCLAVILRETDSAASASEQIHLLIQMADTLRQHHDARTTVQVSCGRERLVGASGFVGGSTGNQHLARKQHRKDKIGELVQRNVKGAPQRPLSTILDEAPRNVYSLALLLQQVVCSMEWSSLSAIRVEGEAPPQQQMAKQLLHRVEGELLEVMDRLGVRSRDVSVLCRRMVDSVLRHPHHPPAV